MNSLTPLLVVDVVGLTPGLLGKHSPNINRLLEQGEMSHLQGTFPAVTTTAQASMLTGLLPAEHGIVGNGWYFRDLAEVKFWLQPNQLVQGEKVWQTLKQQIPDFRCSQLFWWYNMYADVEAAITPRPHYPADGRKEFDLYSQPPGLHQKIEAAIGKFPFHTFWGPAAGIQSSRWIVDCAIAEFELNRPHLQLVYLPHLDYNLQKLGPSHPDIGQDVQAIDREVGRLWDFARSQGAEMLLVSEYGIEEVKRSISLNRSLREAGYLSVRQSLGWELLDPGASRAFAVADHQVAHIYVRQAQEIAEIKSLLEAIPGVERVLDQDAQKEMGIAHPRSGELIAVAEAGAWFNYYYWLDDKLAPDFARTIDIHRKPGYDPVEMFIDPAIRFPKLRIANRLLKKKLGMRMLMDLIPLEPRLIKGSHGRPPANRESGPVLISSYPMGLAEEMHMTGVKSVILKHFLSRG
ncbi:alkaline phosphatase family protein [Bowmanella dokdonensis]|uniref:Alkaline phosphatase family protein n=1 Tax=Bowmanella dokdonensis TaxID=751969 RepID=A0A939IPV1_9ALTE|nr:nucleotide pyrophosphatase/phosphodiesterase family protein [Bowmanella dokdonensis]MBN7823816.1 alkaline phosphatase family protein [Bowmanella dokdonensis]